MTFAEAAAKGARHYGRWARHVQSAAARVQALSGLPRLLAAIAAGGLSASAMAPIYAVPVLFLTLPCLVWLIDGAGPGSRGLARAAGAGWAFGFGYFLAGLHWIGHAFLVDAETFGWMIPFVAVLLPGGLALFTAAAAAAARAVWPAGGARVLVLAVAWVGAEWLRGHILTGFPWNHLGYAWGSVLPVLQAGAFVGLYGLSLLTAVATASGALLGDPPRAGETVRVPRLPLAALLGLAGLAVLGQIRLAHHDPAMVPGLSLRVVHGAFPQALVSDRSQAERLLRDYLILSGRPGIERTTHVIWPEAAVPIVLSREPVALQAIADLLPPGAMLLAGSARVERRDGQRTRVFNSMHAVDSEGLIAATYDKAHLVPFGEYLPAEALLERLGLMKLTGGLGSFDRGPGPRTLVVPGAPAFGPLICYEIIFPAAVRDPALRPQWFVNLTDDSWFGEGVGPLQHFDKARLRAIEEGIPVVRAANRGVSAIIDPLGRVVAASGQKDIGVLDGPLPIARPATVYGRLGDIAFLLLIVSTLGIAFLMRRG